MTLDPALRWLAAACRQEDTPLPAPPVEADELIRLARRHRVQSLLSAGLTRRGVVLGSDRAAPLDAERRQIASDNLLGALEGKRLAGAFAEAGLPLLFVKGLTLSALAYGDPLLKMSRDIDLLVLPSDVVRAGALLVKLGYRPQTTGDPARLARWHRWSKESGWVAPSGLLVELHSRLTDHPAMLPGLRADAAHQKVAVAPGIDLPTLSDDALLAYLAVHGASSAWFRLKWLADLDALLRRRGIEELGALHETMRLLGAGRAAGLALLLLHRVYGWEMPAGLRRVLEEDRLLRWLSDESVRQLQSAIEPTDRPGGTVGIHATQLLIGERWSFPLSEAARRTGEYLVRKTIRG